MSVKNLFDNFENCGKKLKPLYNSLFNEHLYNKLESNEKVDVKKNLFKSFVRSQKKCLCILYSHIIKKHNTNTEHLDITEKIQTIEMKLSMITKEESEILLEVNELN